MSSGSLARQAARAHTDAQRMTARQRIEELTNAWYGYVAFTALAALFREGFPGVFTIAWGLMGLGCTIVCVWFLGKRLLAKSSLTRSVLLVASAIGVVSGGIGLGLRALTFLRDWELHVLTTGIFLGVSVYMYARSWKALTQPSVRAYFD